MDPTLGEFELAAADRGMGDLNHGVCPPIPPRGVLYRAAGDSQLRNADCGLRIKRPRPRRIAGCGLSGRRHRSVERARFPVPESRFPPFPSHPVTYSPSHPPFGSVVHSELRIPHSALERAGSRFPNPGSRHPQPVVYAKMAVRGPKSYAHKGMCIGRIAKTVKNR
jgi:hypothetical protein